jgi:hypothetical protein
MWSFHLLLAAGIPALAATAGEFNILSFNVAGLPAILNGNEVPGDKTDNSRQIGKKFAEYGYDVIHVQEVSPSLLSTVFTDEIGLQLPRVHLRNRQPSLPHSHLWRCGDRFRTEYAFELSVYQLCADQVGDVL